MTENTKVLLRPLGKSGVDVSAVGVGCWAIRGPFWRESRPVGWGQVDDEESVRAIRRAVDLGVTLFDTADVYGCGHSERVLGRGLDGIRDRVLIATKFGNLFDEETRHAAGRDVTPEGIRRSCDASLRRLRVDVIDLYQFHLGDWDPESAPDVRDVLENLVDEGKIRFYGWSTDDPARARIFAEGQHCVAIQQHFNVFSGNEETLAVCEQDGLASINRGPLAQGVLTGKFSAESTFPQDDLRRDWNFGEGDPAQQLEQLAELRDALTSDGRTLAQAALGWLWARSPNTIPIPGCRTVAQVEENAGAMRFGPLSESVMQTCRDIIGS